eukprot:CAMPEP_0118922570 /NCGR_PEP_ID=MMETSP1169-20130426/1450_1 /TAXON_ID=36882 /ORGANISM="Pyramimonas obovata, Strain CCMP722" /LENGTH=445 /DNA_ID=CAMNT_0006863465 /DNA_START=140 /DNA_END=1477 /DNA_ORIENTATION=+
MSSVSTFALPGVTAHNKRDPSAPQSRYRPSWPLKGYLEWKRGRKDVRCLGREGFMRGAVDFRAVGMGGEGTVSRKSVAERRKLRERCVRTYAKDKDNSLAPLKPESPTGEFLNYIIESEPQLFASAMDKQLEQLSEEKDNDASPAEGTAEMVLYQRINEVKVAQRKRALEDLMYASILHKFVNIGVDLLPSLDGVSHIENANYKALTEGVHSVEALELVKQHLSTMLGDAPAAYSNVMIKISKLQAAQVYAASVMFGYFLRRADKRFQLERALGTLPKSPEDTLKSLEAMFNSAGEETEVINPDYPSVDEAAGGMPSLSLKQYVEAFSQETLAETARIVSSEGVTLVERHTGALFGSIDGLQTEMQAALEEEGPAENPQQLMERIQHAVMDDKVATLTLTYSTQRRIILEAVAFGSFLRDVETHVDTEYALLTPAPTMKPPPMLQ